MFSLYSSAYLNNSILLADKVQKNLVSTTKMLDRGVKQAGYWVLWAVSMPSILIEMGFLSNPAEEKYLSDEQHKEAIANAIFQGFAAYYTQMTGNKVSVSNVNPKDNKTEEQTNSDKKHDNSNDNIHDNQPDKAEKREETTVAESEEIRFRVQFIALPEKITPNDKRLQGIPELRCYSENNLWKYTAGNEDNVQSAKEIQNQIKAKYPDAFIIAFKGEEKIPVSEAVKLLKKK